MTALVERTETWVQVCRITALLPERGVAALLPDGSQVALFRTYDNEVYAVSNTDPFSEANVLSRGIVGDRGGVAVVASPMYKEAFDLRTGVCVDNPEVSVPVYPVRVVDEWVQVGLR
ncbi:nitrite reductase small subunit NirD [Gandjariella thermophila]|uniref:Nitrite reductase small subunit n=1 Tax=Gandjariella thermophila TaxID=1931992 RepID=A0A4D4J7V8_9PSEU|nr:nitrite reductase small subunit NirD [Gandjariella thermophila]GDY30047.1 nitrite reductase small subunit [Gandjariella thermophila]